MKHRPTTELPMPGGAWGLVPIVLLGVVLQATAAPLVELRGVRPDWLLVIAVYWGLHLPRGQAVVGAWSIGFLAELLTIERLGLMSVPYALTAWSLVATREALARDSVVTEATAAFVAGLIVFGAWLTYRVVAHGAPSDWVTALGRDWIGRATYTAAWVVPLHFFHRLAASAFASSRTPRPARR